VYRVGEDVYLAATDFSTSEVFMDRVTKAFTFSWQRIEAELRPEWSMRAPDRIESTNPGQRL
jgi:hypothetical protein